MAYVHGYSERETQRLQEQSGILEELLHGGTSYSPGSRVLEVGCGVGAQSLLLLRRNPGIRLSSMDISKTSLEEARRYVNSMGYQDVEFIHGNILEEPADMGPFDHVFVCFVLEHLSEPVLALKNMLSLLRPGGSITVIEGDHGSGIWTPETAESRMAWEGLVISQRKLGHDPDIGRKLYPLMKSSGMDEVQVEPRTAYADASRPELLDGAVNKIIAPMVYSAQKQVLEEGLLDPQSWQKGLDDLERVARLDEGTFYYSWFKGVGICPQDSP